VTTPALPLKVGALVFPGFELLDVFGPLEMFGLLYERATITLVAAAPGPVVSAQGPSCVAETAFRGDLGLDVLLIPGGRGTRPLVQDEAFLLELGRQCAAARIVASVCTGSALLAKAGVLDGLRATTNKRAYAWATANGPRVRWVAQARWVEDGKVFTSSGVSAGMDMALALIARLTGRETALQIAAGAEYEWHEDAAWDPFAALNGLA
jgi:transcriptional regulator GlxA family with amidase domain